MDYDLHHYITLSFSHSPTAILKMTKNQAGSMAYVAIRDMSTILSLTSVTYKIEAKNGVIISTLLGCLLTYSDTMGGKRSRPMAACTSCSAERHRQSPTETV